MVVDADRIDQDVGLFDHGPDFALGVAAVVVAAVGDDQQGFFREFGLTHLADAQVDGIEQGGASFGNGVNQASLNVFDRTGEIGDLFGLVGEGDHEEFVLRIRGLEELDDRFAGALDLAAHAAAHVEDDANRDWGVFAGESLDLLLVLAFERLKLSRSRPVTSRFKVGDGDRHQDQVDSDFVRLGVRLERGVDFGLGGAAGLMRG